PGCNLNGILHLLSKSGMHTDSIDLKRYSICRERLIFYGAQCLAVNGIANISPKLLHIQLINTSANLLIRGKENLDRPVLKLRHFNDMTNRIHYFGYSRLVVRSQKRISTGRDNIIS